MVRVLLIGLCAIIFIVSGFLNIVMLDGRRVGKGADEFVEVVIKSLENNQYPPVSESRTLKEKEQFYRILDGFPKCGYEVKYDDYFFGRWEYKVHFDNGQSYFIAVDAPGTFMTLFAETEYCLAYIEKITIGPEAHK